MQVPDYIKNETNPDLWVSAFMEWKGHEINSQLGVEFRDDLSKWFSAALKSGG